MSPHMTEAEFARLPPMRGAEPSAKPQPVKRRGVMNKTEAAYAAHLDAWRLSSAPLPVAWMDGEYRLERWDFEPERFRLADGTNFTPDFRLTLTSEWGALFIAFHEVKPARRLRTERDGIVRVKWAAQLNPMYSFSIVRPGKAGEWSVQPISASEVTP